MRPMMASSMFLGYPGYMHGPRAQISAGVTGAAALSSNNQEWIHSDSHEDASTRRDMRHAATQISPRSTQNNGMAWHHRLFNSLLVPDTQPQVPAEIFMEQTNLGASFPQTLLNQLQVLDFVYDAELQDGSAPRLKDVDLQDLEEQSGYNLVKDTFHQFDNHMRIGIAQKKLPNGRYELVIALPGTRAVKHWSYNAATSLVECETIFGAGSDVRISRGYKLAYASIRQSLLEGLAVRMKELGRENIATIWFTGHSMGSAMVDLAVADVYQQLQNRISHDFLERYQIRLMTIKLAAPRIGNKAFTEYMLERVPFFGLNIALEYDAVPQGRVSWFEFHPSTRFGPSPAHYKLVIPLHKEVQDVTHHRFDSYTQSLRYYLGSFFS